ncbi:MAG: proline--tRNA ligase [Euryarchaeota archaeon]|nr:proline--tRNA ligase [Euryarchaeota archaeon]
MHVGKADNFSDWYNDIVEKAGLIDKRYPIKGMDVWMPYGWEIMRAMDGRIRAEMAATGHKEVLFPLLIPQTEFNKEKDHIKGFDAQVYWVTKGGKNDLDVPLVVRPTSETAMYPMFALWVRSHADLPLKIFQIVNVFRYETKQTRSFMRVREIHFFEAHTAHDTFEDAERQIVEDLEIATRFARGLGLPYVLSKRPDWDKFAGADYTVGVDVFMHDEAKTLQIASVHQYRQNFAKPYGISYEKPDGSREHCHQTTYGMSERLMGAVIGVHGDDRGIIVPPGIAPIQAVIVPIIFKGKEAGVLESCRAALAELKSAGLRVHLDDRDITAGSKYFDWEMKGVPLRIEIGPRDIEKGEAVLVRRHVSDFKAAKVTAKRAQLAADVAKALESITDDLRETAVQRMHQNVRTVSTPEEAKAREGISALSWCGVEKCGLDIEARTEKTVLGIPKTLEAHDSTHVVVDLEKGHQGKCVICGCETKTLVYVCKTY